MSNSNPGWAYGFTPSAGQWNAQWSTKQDWSATLDQLIAQGGAPSFVAPTTWAPTDASGATLTFSTVSAEFTVIGNIALIAAQLTYPTTASTAAAIIGGLPYPVPNQGYAATPDLVYVAAGAAVLMLPVVNSSTAALYALSSGSAVENVTLSGQTISFQLAYPLS